MALSIVSTPANIDNAATFNVTTSLVEDGTHVNLRVRADVYHEGIIKAVVEKPKGLADFDFGDILKSLTPGLKFAKDSGDLVKTGTIGSNLITAWTDKDTTFGTLTTSANAISSAICTTSSIAQTNIITMAVGELYLFYAADFITSGAYVPRVYLSTGGALETIMLTNKSIIIMPTSAGSLRVYLGNRANMNFSGTFGLVKITTNRTTIGSLLAPYFAIFTEVYEDAAGVTQAGTPLPSQLKRFVPAIGDGTAFSNYVLTPSGAPNPYLFANKTFRNNVVKFFTVNPSEYWIVFFTEEVEDTLYYIKDSDDEPRGFGTAFNFLCPEGWGVVVLNIGELMSSVTNKLCIRLGDTGGLAQLSEKISIYVDASNIAERTVLEFDGLVGGKEYLAFEGLKDLNYETARNYYTKSTGIKGILSLIGKVKQKLETRFKDMANADYLKSLLASENVKKLNASYIDTDVTVITDSVKTDAGVNLFVNQIEIEY